MSNSAFLNFVSKPIVIIIGSVILAVAIGIDIWLAVDPVDDNTWSELMRLGALATPVIPWACGVLMGHWFHPNDNAQAVLGQPGSIALLLWLTWVVFLVGLAFISSGISLDPSLLVVPGMVAGWLLWPV